MTFAQILAQGAEATLYKQGKSVRKERTKKSYRLPQLDERIRKQRTRAEARLLEKATLAIPVPKVINVSLDKKEITLEYLKGKKLADILDTLKNKNTISAQIGKNIAKLHDTGIIHADLTTSNMILSNSKVYFIDFGLGFQSQNVEDKAVDLHVLKEALSARHYRSAQSCWNAIATAYKKSSPAGMQVLKRLDAVEKRGRYKTQI